MPWAPPEAEAESPAWTPPEVAEWKPPEVDADPRATRKAALLAERDRLAALPEPKATDYLGGEIAERSGELLRGATQVVPSTLRTIAAGGDYLNRKLGLDDTPLEDLATTRAAGAVEGSLDRNLPAPAPEDRDLGHDIMRGFGQVGSMVGVGLGARLAGAGIKTAALAGSASGFGQEFDDAFTQAQARGDDPDTAFYKALGYGSLATAIENRLGAGRLLKKYFPSPAAAAQKLTALGVSKELVGNFVAGGLEEGSQRFAQNWIVGEQPSMEGVAREAGVGALVQGLIGAPAAARTGRDTLPRVRQEDAQERIPTGDAPEVVINEATGTSEFPPIENDIFAPPGEATLSSPSSAPAIEGDKSVAPPPIATFTGPNGESIEVETGGASLDAVKEMVFRAHPGAEFVSAENVAEAPEVDKPSKPAEIEPLGRAGASSTPAVKAGDVGSSPTTALPPGAVAYEQIKPSATVKDVTPEGFGPSEKESDPIVEHRLRGETLDDAIARKVGYQIENGLVKIYKDGDSWVARIAQPDGKPRVFKSFRKHQVLNEAFAEFYPNTQLLASEPRISPPAQVAPTEATPRPTVDTVGLSREQENYLSRMATRASSVASQTEGGRGVAVGSGQVEYRWREAALYDIRDALRAGKSLAEAEEIAKQKSKQYVQAHNAKRPKDYMAWQRWDESTYRFIENTVSDLREIQRGQMDETGALIKPSPPAQVAPTEATKQTVTGSNVQTGTEMPVQTEAQAGSGLKPRPTAEPAPEAEQLRLLDLPRLDKPLEIQRQQLRRVLDEIDQREAESERPVGYDSPWAARRDALETRLAQIEEAQLHRAFAGMSDAEALDYALRRVRTSAIEAEQRRQENEATDKRVAEARAARERNLAAGLNPEGTPKTLNAGNVETRASVRTAQRPTVEGEFSAKAAREQKMWLLDAVDKAIADAPDTDHAQAVRSTAHYKTLYEYNQWMEDNPQPEVQTEKGYNETDVAALARVQQERAALAQWQQQASAELPGQIARQLGLEGKTIDLWNSVADVLNRKAYEELPHVVIEVPGDGTFSVVNTKRALEEFKLKAKDFPTSLPKSRTPSATRTVNPTAPAKVGKLDSASALDVAGDFTAKPDAGRAVLENVWSDGKQTVATDGRRLIRIDAGQKGATEKKPASFDKTGRKISERDAVQFPNWRQIVIPPKELSVVAEADAAQLFNIVKQAEAMTSERSQSVKLWRNPDGALGVSSVDPDAGEYAHNIQKGAKLVKAVNPEFLLDALNAARKLGSEKVTFETQFNPPVRVEKGTKPAITSERGPLVIRGNGFEVITMPMSGAEGEFLQAKDLAKPAPVSGALDAAEQAVADLQKKIRGSGDRLGTSLPQAALDFALETLRLSLKAGKSIAVAIEDAIRALRAKFPTLKFDEAALRVRLENEFHSTRTAPDPEGPRKEAARKLGVRLEGLAGIPAEVKQALVDRTYEVASMKGSVAAARYVLEQVGPDAAAALVFDEQGALPQAVRGALPAVLAEHWNGEISRANTEQGKWAARQAMSDFFNDLLPYSTGRGQFIAALKALSWLDPQGAILLAKKQLGTAAQWHLDSYRNLLQQSRAALRQAQEQAWHDTRASKDAQAAGRAAVNENVLAQADKPGTEIYKAVTQEAVADMANNPALARQTAKAGNLVDLILDAQGNPVFGKALVDKLVAAGMSQAQAESLNRQLEAAFKAAGKQARERARKALTSTSTESQLDRAIKRELHRQQVKLSDAVKGNQLAGLKQSIGDAIVDASGLSGPAADKLRAVLNARFDSLAKARKRAAVERLLRGQSNAVKRKFTPVFEKAIATHNLTLDDPDSFKAWLRKEMGLGEVTPEQEAKLRALAEAVQAIPRDQEIKRGRAAQELMTQIGRIARTQGTFGQLLGAVWYADILSGMASVVNIWGNVSNIFLNAAVNLATRPGTVPAQVEVVRARLGGAFWDMVNTMHEGALPGQKEVYGKRRLEDLHGWERAFLPLRYVGRALEAGDILFADIYKDSRFAALAALAAKHDGLSGEALRRRVLAEAGALPEQFAGALTQAAAEGYAGYKQRQRAHEILEQQRGEDFAAREESAADYATREVFREDPYGLAGWLAKIAKQGIGKFPLLTPVAPFPILTSNLFNAAFNYVPPIAAYRLWKARPAPVNMKFAFGRDGTLYGRQLDLTSPGDRMLLQDHQTKLLLSSAALTALMMAFMPDKEGDDPANDKWGLFGRGPTNPDQRKAWEAAGGKPTSIRLNGVNYDYKAWIIGPALGILGHAFDAVRWPHAKATNTDRLTYMSLGLVRTMMETPVLDGVTRLLDTAQAAVNGQKDVGQRLHQYLARAGGGFIYGRAFLDALDRFDDPTRYEGEGIRGLWMSQVPFARRWSEGQHPVLNALGEPVKSGPLERFFKPEAAETTWTRLSAINLYPSAPSQGELTENEFYDLVKLRGEIYRGLLDGAMEELRALPNAEAKARVSNLGAAATRQAKRQLGLDAVEAQRRQSARETQ